MTQRTDSFSADAWGSAVKPLRAALLVLVVGLAFTAAGVWAAWRSNDHNEDRLLQSRTRQAASVIGGAVASIVHPLQTSLQVAAEAAGSPTSFARSMAPSVGPGKTFVSASLWTADGLQPITTVGEPPDLDPQSPAGRAALEAATKSSSFVVVGIPKERPRHVGYALRAGPYVAYAERAIPANRQVPVESDSAFAGLHFATYLGRNTRTADVATTDQSLDDLPITGGTATASIPFGNTVITLVTKPDGHLGGSLGWRLPWIILVVGVVLVAIAAVITEQLVRRKRRAETDADTIARLYQEVNELYGEQRSIALALQEALLPHHNPDIAALEIASRYVAGTQGIDIGGDWYSIVKIDDHRFGFVVGDVMGRGVDAATIMARLRYTVRAYLLEGHSPEHTLAMTGRQLDIVDDGHFATILVGVGDLDTGRLRIANAGHLDPLMLFDGEATYVSTDAGAAVGVFEDSYHSTEIQLARGAAVLLFTDGLVEQRGTSIDDGLAQLRRVVRDAPDSLDRLVESVLHEMIGDGAEDDTALLVFRWKQEIPSGA
jgi:serine phosphatase RsbU (regulator of sigma subunit)